MSSTSSAEARDVFGKFEDVPNDPEEFRLKKW